MVGTTEVVLVLWGALRGQRARFVGAWPKDLAVHAPWTYAQRREIAEKHHTADQDPSLGAWTYWVTEERLARPAMPTEVTA